MSNQDWWFLDLAAVIAVTGTLTFGLFTDVTGPIRIVLALPLVLFLPGYALVSVLFPDETDDDYQAFDDGKTGLRNPLLLTRGLEPVERLVLSVVFSVALVPALTLLATVTPRGMTAEPILAGVAIVTVTFTCVAIASRYRCSPDRRYVPTPVKALPRFTRRRPDTYAATDPRPYNIAIAMGLVLLVASGGFAFANPPQHDGFTEFAVDTDDVSGDTETMYESSYDVDETQELPVTITNREHEERTYTTVALLERVHDDGDETVAERTELTSASTTVDDGATAEQPLEITPTMAGDDLRLTLLLFEGDPPAEPTAEDAYRVIHLPIEVS